MHQTFLCLVRPDLTPTQCHKLIESYGAQALSVLLWESETERLDGSAKAARGACAIRKYRCRVAHLDPGEYGWMMGLAGSRPAWQDLGSAARVALGLPGECL